MILCIKQREHTAQYRQIQEHTLVHIHARTHTICLVIDQVFVVRSNLLVSIESSGREQKYLVSQNIIATAELCP